MIPDLVRVDIGEWLTGAFAETGAAHAFGLADQFAIEAAGGKFSQKPVVKDFGFTGPVAAWPCADDEPPCRRKSFGLILRLHGRQSGLITLLLS
jgi:hypothetical protein